MPPPPASLLGLLAAAIMVATAAAALASKPAASVAAVIHAAAARRTPPPPQLQSPRECLFLDYDRNPNLTSYEFQLQPHRGLIWDFERAAAAIERLMKRLTIESRDAQRQHEQQQQQHQPAALDAQLLSRRWPTTAANFTFVERSRWDTVLREHAFAVSTRRGAPLHPSRFPPRHRFPFPWHRLAYLRLRRYIITLPPGTAPGAAPPPGTADLALKLKKVDPRLGPLQGLPPGFFREGVRAKLEADVHCDHQRVSVSPLFAPVPADLNVSRVRGVADYFPGLAEVARLDPDEILPFCHAVWRRKATWAVVYRGLVGEVGLVAKYNTTLADAVAGRRAKNGEVSLRIRREVAGIAREGESETERLLALDEAMDALAIATQRFRDEGWDGKTPGLDGGRRRSRRRRRPRRWSLAWWRRREDEEEDGDVAALLRAAEAEGFVEELEEEEEENDSEEATCERAVAVAVV